MHLRPVPLLHKGGIDGPIVLVGHSIGAVWARMYAERYPGEVQGIVLNDHAGAYRMTPMRLVSDRCRRSARPAALPLPRRLIQER